MSFTGSLSASGSSASQSVTGMVAVAGSITNSSLVSASDAAHLVLDHSPAPGLSMAAAAVSELGAALEAGDEESSRGIPSPMVEELLNLRNNLPFSSFGQPESEDQLPIADAEHHEPPQDVIVSFDDSVEAALEGVMQDAVTGRIHVDVPESRGGEGPAPPEQPYTVDETKFR